MRSISSVFGVRHLSEEELERWLGEAAPAQCRICEKPLRRFEVLSARLCEVCCAKAEQEEETARRQRRHNLREIGVPHRYREFTRSKWQGVYPEKLTAFVGNPTVTLVCIGPTNAGKTHAATAALASICAEKRISCRWCGVLKLLEDLRLEERSERPLFRSLLRVCVLLLDDYGQERETDYAAERLTTILRIRDEEGKGTLLTTNLARDQLEEENPSLATRLFRVPPVDFA